MIVTITTAGQALLDANQGPITLTSVVIGSGYGYIPQATDTNIHGQILWTGVPSNPIVVNANVVKYDTYLDYSVGPFLFGEVGLFVGSTLFALAASDTLIQKTQTTSNATGNSIRIEEYLSIVSTNYQMWLDLGTSSNQFEMAILSSVDQLPPPQSATPNAYIVSGAGPGQSAFQAYTDKNSLWNFDAYQYANQVQLPIIGFDTKSVTIDLGNYQPSFNPAYFGQIILEFASGALYGICRYIQSVVVSGASATLNFKSTLLQIPSIGDSIILFGRQALSTTISNIPIATTSQLGGVIVGPTLTVTQTGLLNIAPGAYPVSSVNGLTGAVVLNASNISGFAAVAYSGKYSDLLGAPGPYSLPIASKTQLGGVKAPADLNLTVAGDGTIDLGFSPVKTVNGVAPDASGNVDTGVTPNSVVTSFNTRTGAVTLQASDISGAGGALTGTANSWLGANNFVSGSVLVPTRLAGDNTTNAASTAFVQNALASFTNGVTSFNGRQGAVSLTSADVVAAGGITTLQFDQQRGVPQLDSGSVSTATDPYTFGRMLFWENTLGTWWNAGTWNASTNQIKQTGLSSYDANTKLLASGQQTIDISYGGKGRSTITTGDYQSVSGEGMVYVVGVAGTTSIDGINAWSVGDLVVGSQGKWTRIQNPANATKQVYDMTFGAIGTVAASQSLGFYPIVRSITFPGNFSGSLAFCLTAPAAQVVCNIQVGGSSVGTITFNSGSTNGTFTSSGGAAVTPAVTGTISIVAPSTADSAWANVSIVLAGSVN
jgi:hypothetical protein